MARATQSAEALRHSTPERSFAASSAVLGIALASLALVVAMAFRDDSPTPHPPGSVSSQSVSPQSEVTETRDRVRVASIVEAPSGAGSFEREQRALADFIARRFKVARDATGEFVAAAFRAGLEHRVDPVLILAVIAVESSFNPVAESSVGAKGLMQVLPQYHQDKLAAHGGETALLDPLLNIDIGTRILREYLRRAGETQSGLQMYGGAFEEPTARYAGKVLSERARLEQLLLRVRRTDA
jgi:soluble lytic murein transglycosylase-like protein